MDTGRISRAAHRRPWAVTTRALLLAGLVALGHPVVAREALDACGATAPLAAVQQLAAAFQVVCTGPEDGADRQVEAEVSVLATDLAPLLSPDLPDEVKLEYARLVQARAVLEQAQAHQAEQDSLLEAIALASPERMPEMIAVLGERLEEVAVLRATRASIARLSVQHGRRALALRPPAGDRRLEDAVADAVLAEFEAVRARGVDCSKSSLYEFFHTRSLVVATRDEGTLVHHRDLLDLMGRQQLLARAWEGCMGSGGAGDCSGGSTVHDVVNLYQAVKDMHARAVEVLGEAVALLANSLQTVDSLVAYGKALEADHPDHAVAVVFDAPGFEASGENAAHAEGEASSAGVSSVVAQVRPADLSAGSVSREPDPVETRQEPAPREPVAGVGEKEEPVAAVDSADQEAARDSSLPAHPAAGRSRGVEMARSEVDLATARRKAEIIRQVNLQADMLRQPGAGGGGGIEPLALANNLLYRSKRVYQLADMLAVGEQDGEVYECTIADDTIHIAYRTRNGDLAAMQVVVSERYLGRVVMTWTLSLERKNDRNFRIGAEFGGKKAALVVENGKVVDDPNHYELLVLMNRLCAIAYMEPGPGGVKTASR